jgi:PAS domain S-box-containing protein
MGNDGSSHAASLPLLAILTAAPDALLVVDASGLIVLASEVAEAMFGYPSGELVGRGVEQLLPDSVRARHADFRGEFHRRATRRPMGEGRSLVARRADGAVFPVDVGLSPVDGAPHLVTCVVRDLTATGNAEHMLRVQNVALEAAANGIVITDIGGKIRWTNPAFTKMTGYAAEEVVGRDPSILKSGVHPPEFYRALWTTVAAGDPWYGEMTNRRKDGSLYVEEQTIALVRSSAGDITHFIAIKQDVTERRRVEAQLVEAKEAAEAAARAKAEFLANTSHELRTPLNAVLGFSELLLETDLDARQHGMLETIQQSGELLLALINDLLDLSKLEAGRLELDLHLVELEPLFATAIAQVAPRALEKRLELLWTIDPAVPAWIVADGLRLSQIVLNLVGNAAKFTDRGEVSVHVELASVVTSTASATSSTSVPGPTGAKQTPRPGEPIRLRVTVQDSGLGIPQDRRDRLFQKFAQLDASSTRRFGGTGLGLAITKALVERMGGRVEVESEGVPGRGSRFMFEIDAVTAAPRGSAIPPEPRLMGRRVAVLAVHAGLAQSLIRTLRALGLEAVVPSADSRLLDVDVVLVDEPIAAGFVERHLGEAAIVVLSPVGAARVEGSSPRRRIAPLSKPVRPRSLRDVLIRLLGTVPRMEAVQRPSLGSRSLPPMRVLLAEDSVVNQQVITAQLARLGVQADVVPDGRAALAAIASGRYDLCLLDVNMPELDGLEVARAVRKLDGAAARTVLVALTASAMAGDRERCLAAGMDEYVSKPVRIPALEAALRRASAPLGRPDAPDSLPSSAHLPIAARLASSPPRIVEVVEAALDAQTIVELRRDLGDEAAFDDLMLTFLESAVGLLKDAATAARAGDARAAQRAVHTLKGSAGSCGAPVVARLAAELERRFQAADFARAEPDLDAVRTALERFREELSASPPHA